MTETRTIKVAIVEDLRDIREGLAQLINATPGFRCTGVYASMEEVIEKIPQNLPDLVLSDIGLPGMDGISGIAILKARFPELLILMLTVYDDNERIFDALCAGACGYLLKKTPWPKLVDALKEAVEGGSPMSPEVARRVINLFREIKPPKEASYELTPHEVRLLRMLVEGHSYKTAANELKVSVNTIKFHLRHIYNKLQVHTKSEAVAKALRHGLTR
ncbi:MAG TPA: response regulator transcription factor [Pyrinomonadaceae bacterium]|nr:response regulator transcription factor [Pyrinomonadaceae bacterium]